MSDKISDPSAHEVMREFRTRHKRHMLSNFRIALFYVGVLMIVGAVMSCFPSINWPGVLSGSLFLLSICLFAYNSMIKEETFDSANNAQWSLWLPPKGKFKERLDEARAEYVQGRERKYDSHTLRERMHYSEWNNPPVNKIIFARRVRMYTVLAHIMWFLFLVSLIAFVKIIIFVIMLGCTICAFSIMHAKANPVYSKPS